jgi:peptidoglycan/xylan/chitin deacetylase (PgdA/CDA1 family)
MAHHFVCLTFDYDNTSAKIAAGMTTPTAISRGEFGVVGTERLLALLRLHGIATTWFIPGHSIESYSASCARIVEAGHEIGHHGWTHRTPVSLSQEEEERELVRGNEAIVRLAGRSARGYRSPSWDLSPHSIALLLKHGFVYDSSLMDHDYLPYQAREGDVVTLQEPICHGTDTTLVEMPISWSLDDYPAFEYSYSDNMLQQGLMNARLVGENWFDDFAYMRDHHDWGVLTYTFHPHIIGRGHRMMMLERLIDRLADAGATFLTMERAVEEYRRRFPSGRSEPGR